MRIGKLPENVWKRSVFRHINKTKREEVKTGAGIGEDCAVFSFGSEEMTSVSLCTVCRPGEDTARLAIYGSVNMLAASGAEPVAVNISALMPEGTEEESVRSMAVQTGEECALLGIQAAGIHIQVTKGISCPAITVAGIGRQAAEGISLKGIKPGQDIVVSKWIGLEGTSIIAKEKQQELLKRYPMRLIQTAQAFDQYLSVLPEAAVAVKSSVSAMHDVTEGGIFGALWELAESSGVGLEIDLKKIPVRQETIEISEFFQINPYELISSGCMLMASPDGNELLRNLQKAGIPAALIGKAMSGNDRVLLNEEERRFLEPPKTDQLYKVI